MPKFVVREPVREPEKQKWLTNRGEYDQVVGNPVSVELC